MNYEGNAKQFNIQGVKRSELLSDFESGLSMNKQRSDW